MIDLEWGMRTLGAAEDNYFRTAVASTRFDQIVKQVQGAKTHD